MTRVCILGCLGLVTACGRVDFDPRGAGDAPTTGDGLGSDATPGTLAWVKSFVGHALQASVVTDMFSTTATQAGDAVVLHLFCQSTATPTAVSISSPGWTLTEIAGITGSGSFWAASFGAIAPNTAPATFTVTWTAASMCTFVDELGDEFSGNDASGGTTTFDAAVNGTGTGACTASLTTKHDSVAVWSACTVDTVSGTGPGYVKGSDDSRGDWSEFKLSADPANTIETPTFTTTTGTSTYVITSVTIKPR